MLAGTAEFPRPAPRGCQRCPGEDVRSLQLSHLIEIKRTTSTQTNHMYVPTSTAAKLCSPQSDLIFFRAPGNPFIKRHYLQLPGAPNPGTRLLEFMRLRAVGPGDRPCPALTFPCSHTAAPIPMVCPSVHPSVCPSTQHSAAMGMSRRPQRSSEMLAGDGGVERRWCRKAKTKRNQFAAASAHKQPSPLCREVLMKRFPCWRKAKPLPAACNQARWTEPPASGPAQAIISGLG